MDDMEIVIIDSVQPGNHDLLDQKEEEWIHRLRTMDIMGQGGLNIRDDLKRTNRGKCKCKFCKKVKKYLRGQRKINMETVIMFTFWFVKVYYVPVYVRNIFSA